MLVILLASLISAQAGTSLSEERRAAAQAIAEAADSAPRGAPVGTEHAPVDGKDGMPHQGPWIETEAERRGKKSKSKEEMIEVPSRSSKSTTSIIPQSNEGVMDDKGRGKPKEGTRGTEGGVSQRKATEYEDKKPEQPKEAPPLPHSEKEKLQAPETGEKLVEEEDKGSKPLAVSSIVSKQFKIY